MDNSLKNFLAKNNKIRLVLSGILLALVPVLGCFLWILIKGGSVDRVFLGASPWNDELIYYKQIECMVRDNIPRGYFGYDESRALIGSFGAWTPALLIPWAIFGKVFGWTYNTVFFANYFFLALALFGFVLLSKFDLKKTVVAGGILLLMEPLQRYLLSSMTEIICVSYLCIFAGLLLGYRDSNHKKLYFAFMLAVLAILTILRPYFVIFFAFTYAVTHKSKLKIALTTVTAAGSLLATFAIFDYFTCPYLGDVFHTEIFTMLFEEGFFATLKYFFETLFHYIFAILSASYGGLKSGYGPGIYFGTFLVMTLLLFIQLLLNRKKKNVAIPIIMIVCHILMLLALIFMYNLQDGFRHLMAFIVMDILLIVYEDTNRCKISVAAMVTVLVYLAIRTVNPLYFEIPFDGSDGVSKACIEDLRKELDRCMFTTDGCSYDNDVIVVFMDKEAGSSEEETVIKWQYGYAIPEGFAISLCTSEYIYANVGSLMSRYIMTQSGGAIEQLIKDGCEYIAGNEEIAFYRILN